MELRHLRYFLGVAESLNFTRAAEKLRIAQPALSRQISDLEAEMGIRLFDRSTKGVRLTEPGAYFRGKVGKVLEQLDGAVVRAQRIARGMPLSIRVGIDYAYSAIPIAAAARMLRERHPTLSVDFVELPGYRHLDAVRSGAIDVGFISGFLSGSRQGVETTSICKCPMKAVVPSGHRLARRDSVRLEELREERWVVAADFPGFALMLTEIFRHSGFAPKIGPAARSLSGILTLVGNGEGLGLIAAIKLPPEPDNVVYLDTDSPPYELLAVWLKANPSGFVPEYVEILRQRLGLAKPPARPRSRPV
jgi:DNA-binding transcriptional LysR family regulator